MQQVKSGDTVKVHYHGKLTDGTTFDSSEGREPLEFEVGNGSVIPGFDSGVTGMQVGEKKQLIFLLMKLMGRNRKTFLWSFPLTVFLLR
jgi:peptidylprolyl isomerase